MLAQSDALGKWRGPSKLSKLAKQTTPLKLDIERRLTSSMRKGKVFWLQVNKLTAFHPP